MATINVFDDGVSEKGEVLYSISSDTPKKTLGQLDFEIGALEAQKVELQNKITDTDTAIADKTTERSEVDPAVTAQIAKRP